MKRLVVLTGAGMSAESGISTFRDNNGLWNNHRVEDVATPEAWTRNPALVTEFYNQRRKQLFEVEPNAGHLALAELENEFDVHIITQNVDDLHERAGSKNVLHLHGELKKIRSSVDPALVFECKSWEVKPGDLCPKGSMLRPHIVWFGEPVPMIEPAIEIASQAEILVVIGTSMVVYPAASLIHYVRPEIPKFYIDPQAFPIQGIKNLHIIKEKAGIGVAMLAQQL
jgi:NAD-dependent deacetylase